MFIGTTKNMLHTASGTSLSNNGSCYSNDRFNNANESELASDLASSGFFNSECKKYDDLKQMLDSSKDGLKLEAMKRIIGMIAKGRDASDLFPSVVKNVVSKNIEVKKLVYVYLVRYAEDQQDLALLSISTFQRALKDPNQLIRASALRVLSSIRVSMIVPIVMLAIKDSASDMSPYVRKTAAHAIPKLFSLDPEQKEELVSVLEKLLSDKTTLVVGSAVMAFEEVCPERIDLIHKNYRKLCNLLVDIDEWGQIIIVNMLTRYVRSQFLNPNLDADFEDEEDESRPFYDSDSEISVVKKSKVTLDSDHKLLLRNSKPLLQSRNAAVVMAVAQLYYHAAPRTESLFAAKALIRLLRSHREVQVVVLHTIASISVTRKGMFEPFLKSFFVRTSDPTRVKLLKIEILTNLANETNINTILREFQTYISSSDKEFAAASIQAIGLCASNIERVTDTCLNGLVALLSNRDEAIVAESVVVIKKLLQTQPNEHKEIIAHMAKLMDFITVPQARASILWLLGEYSNRVPKIAPDVLRKMAKTFVNEQDIVKLQTLNLAVKLYLINPEQISKFAEYVFQLAKYDQNYDIRDRARFLKFFISNKENPDLNLSACARKIFLATKPAPLLTPRFKNTEFQLGTLSHYLNMPCKNYKALPGFPEVQPDSSVREVPESASNCTLKASLQQKKEKKIKGNEENFYEGVESIDDQETDSSDNKTSSDSSEEESDSDDVSDSSEEDNYKEKNVRKIKKSEEESSSEVSDSENSSDSESSFEEDSDSKNYSEEQKTSMTTFKKKVENSKEKKEVRTNLDLLLDLDEVIPMTPVMTPSLGGFLSPISSVSSVHSKEVKEVPASFIPTKKYELLNKVSSRGFHLEYRFTRSQHLASSALVNIELLFQNNSSETICNIHVGNKNLSKGVSVYDFSPISTLLPNSLLPCSIGINFNDSTQPVNFDIGYLIKEEEMNRKIEIKAPIGEIIRSVVIPESMFVSEKEKLKGMNEHTAVVKFSGSIKEVSNKILEVANLAVLTTEDDNIKFAAHTITSKSLVLVTLKKITNDIDICVNCEKMVIGSMLLNEIKNSLK